MNLEYWIILIWLFRCIVSRILGYSHLVIWVHLEYTGYLKYLENQSKQSQENNFNRE